MNASNEPTNLVECAADIAMNAARNYLEVEGAEVEQMLVLLRISGQPKGELDCVSAGQNVGDARDLIAMLAGHFISAAEQVGIKVSLIEAAQRNEG